METLFRGKSQYAKHEWLFGSLVHLDKFGEVRSYIIPVDFDGRWTERRVIQDHLYQTVGQWTGVTTIGDVDIFKDDIFFLDGDVDTLYVVEWHDCGFMGRRITVKENEHSTEYIGLEHHLHLINVKGNIHDHKHLLCK